MADLETFRAELRSWLAENVTDDLRGENAALLPEAERVRRLRAWQKKLADARWVGITWPREFGGRAATIPEQIAYTEEMARARAPEVIGQLGIGIAGPPIMAYGDEAQKRRFLRRILTAEDLWCFGFSEPGAGSDLASLRTAALPKDDHFEVTGQKVWTTLAQHADWCMLLCRTDPETRRREGISCLLVDMQSPGITVRPLRQMTGEAEFNEVFFESVRVPRENLLGELHGGWQIAVSALQNERGILYVVGMQILLSGARDRLFALARERGAGRDPVRRQALAAVHLGTEIFRMNCQRTLDKLLRMEMPGPEASIIKLHWTELTQAMPRIGMEILGPEGLRYDGTASPAQWVQKGYLGSPAASIASGTSEIMRGIIAMQVLGLPRGS
ncbi:MAG: acyl-CoA dehydrogenase [Deltaproteobacteria bacterium]|nr:MAG: acyl-CoA dehydrogenase [Deltaproteobacteria bacterium]TMB44981.1 MAG: acyl-CoA dehydrogenase [Deltaproteobacteria bacterium]